MAEIANFITHQIFPLYGMFGQVSGLILPKCLLQACREGLYEW